MQARKYIGTGICPVENPHRIHKHILPFKYHRSEILSVREKGTDNQENRHPGK